MLTRTLATMILLALISAPAEARKRGHKKIHSTNYSQNTNTGKLDQHAAIYRGYVEDQEQTRYRTTPRHRDHIRTKMVKSHGRSVSLAGIVAPQLIAKAQEIMSACGSIVVSARASRRNRSNHPIGRAVDMQGNPACIYSHLHGWPGGVSTDYYTAPGGKHVHISYNPGGMEWGVRFAHRHYGHKTRYAKKRHRHYATVM